MSKDKVVFETMNPVNTQRKEYIISAYTQGQIWFVVAWKFDPVWDDGAGNLREDYAKDYATYVKPADFDTIKSTLETRDVANAILNIKTDDEVMKNLYAYINASKGDYHIEYVTVAEGNKITDLILSKSPVKASA